MGATQQSSASTTPAEVCRNRERAESLKVFIKKKTCQTFVLDETPELMRGVDVCVLYEVVFNCLKPYV